MNWERICERFIVPDMSELLARAVIIRGETVLVARMKGAAFTFLPGGHVEEGEGLQGALSRELFEELGVNVTTSEYLGFAEHVWFEQAKPVWEINHCFAVAIRSDVSMVSKEAALAFEWVRLSRLSEVNLQPPTLVSLITRYVSGDHSIWAEPRTRG